MQNSFAPRGGFALRKTPSHRQRVLRHRLMAVAAIVALAFASGLIGFATRQPAGVSVEAQTGPLSYYPSQ
ncbi:MAG: hypothetical protein ABI655_11280 [Phenylobacterium sp.]